MLTVDQVMSELEKKGSEQTRKTLVRHCTVGPMFGVKIGDLKVIAKKIKGEQELACSLFETGNHDAMYLAGIVADGAQMTTKQLDAWAKAAASPMIAEYTVPGVASESPHARSLALKWMRSRKEPVACAGWNTYAGLISVLDDDDLDLGEIADLLDAVLAQIDAAPNKVRYSMNNFVIAVGAYVRPLLKKAKATAKKLGAVTVDMGDTACQVPVAIASIEKIEGMGRVGKKRKSAKC